MTNAPPRPFLLVPPILCIASLTAEGFEVQVAQGQTVDNVKLRFADVKSVSEKPPNKGTRPWVWVLTGAGILFVVLVVLAATTLNKS